MTIPKEKAFHITHQLFYFFNIIVLNSIEIFLQLKAIKRFQHYKDCTSFQSNPSSRKTRNNLLHPLLSCFPRYYNRRRRLPKYEYQYQLHASQAYQYMQYSHTVPPSESWHIPESHRHWDCTLCCSKDHLALPGLHETHTFVSQWSLEKEATN